MDKQAILTEVSRIAQQAGIILSTNFGKPITKTTKSSDIDIVTEADEAAEAFISRELLRLYPDFHLIGEEGGGQGAPIDDADYHWYVDPIDGTTNFASGIPHFCVSIALTDADRNPLIAVIYNPNQNDLYTAIQGAGAHLNGESIHVTTTNTLIQSVLASGFAYDKHTNDNDNTAQWAAFVKKVRGIRRIGSAALDLAYVAAGRFDGYWERSLNPWDALAGILLVTEAGGKVTDYHGGDRPQWDEDGRFVATNGKIHQLMLDVLSETYGWG